MADVKIINKFGELLGWLNQSTELFGRVLEGITAVEYSDTQKMEQAYGAGRFPVGYTKGNFETKASITIYKDELIALQAALPEGMRLQDIPPFPIIVNFEQGDTVFKDIINNCIITGNQTALKQGEGKIEVQLELLTSHITWGA